jgi:hypothetical protein
MAAQMAEEIRLAAICNQEELLTTPPEPAPSGIQAIAEPAHVGLQPATEMQQSQAEVQPSEAEPLACEPQSSPMAEQLEAEINSEETPGAVGSVEKPLEKAHEDSEPTRAASLFERLSLSSWVPHDWALRHTLGALFLGGGGTGAYLLWDHLPSLPSLPALPNFSSASSAKTDSQAAASTPSVAQTLRATMSKKSAVLGTSAAPDPSMTAPVTREPADTEPIRKPARQAREAGGGAGAGGAGEREAGGATAKSPGAGASLALTTAVSSALAAALGVRLLLLLPFSP